MKEITPTVGFNVEQFARSGINFTVFDMSGSIGSACSAIMGCFEKLCQGLENIVLFGSIILRTQML